MSTVPSENIPDQTKIGSQNISSGSPLAHCSPGPEPTGCPSLACVMAAATDRPPWLPLPGSSGPVRTCNIPASPGQGIPRSEPPVASYLCKGLDPFSGSKSLHDPYPLTSPPSLSPSHTPLQPATALMLFSHSKQFSTPDPCSSLCLEASSRSCLPCSLEQCLAQSRFVMKIC